MTTSTLTLRATETAIKAAGILPHQEQAPPQTVIGTLPAPTDVGWLVQDTVSALLAVRLRVDPRRRTTYLVIDRATAPLTGNYVIEVNAGGAASVTYDATAGAPADVDALLAAIVAALNALSGAGQIGTKVVADTYAMTATGALDAIRLRSLVSVGTHIVTSTTAFPGAAALALVAELDTATALDLYARTAIEVDAGMSGTPPYIDASAGWVLVEDIAVGLPGGVVSSGGYLERIDVAGLTALYPHIEGALTDTYTPRSAIAHITVAPARTT